jgi:hypothetical protein
MSKRDTLTLNRTGEFAFTVLGDKHCGMAPTGTVQQARYRVTTKCQPILDGNGYLFEQLAVQAYFDKIKRVSSTCEKLVMRVADELVDVIMRENPSCEVIWIEVEIIAAPYAASMTYRLHP